MTTDIQRQPAIAPVAPISLRSRLFGLGSVFGKAIRDSRRAFLIEVLFLGGFLLVILAGVGTAYPTQAARDELARLANDMGPAAQGIAGRPVNVGTMGGYVEWKYGSVLLLIAAMWSVLALSGTLAGEARRGSLDFLTAAPLGKRRIAVEKVAAHLTLLTVVMVVLALAAWLAGARFAKLPGDEIPPRAAVGFALWIGLMALAFGALAFALAQFLGRAAASWIAGFILVAGPILNNYRTLVPAFGGVAEVTPWAWTANYLPLAGQYDWGSLVPVAIVAVVLIPAGIEAFARRDLGASSTIRTPGLPAATRGLRGPVGRSFSERLPLALAWGLGLGAFGLIMAAGSRSLANELAKSPDLARALHGVFPSFDLTSAGGFLQLMVQLLFIVVGFAAATLVSGWAADETSGRLEMLLAGPLSRRSWAILSGLGVFAAIALMTVIMALAIGLGAAAAGSDALTPMAGTFALGLFAVALAGAGFAIGGLVRTSVAAQIVAVVVIATYLVDLLVPALDLPAGAHQLALTAHLGQPMVGVWDAAGVVACLVLAVGGLALGGLGFARRDVRGSNG
jgi:ABC-2 type transport system permease protein